MYYKEKIGKYWVVFHNGKELASFRFASGANDFIKEEKARMKKFFAQEKLN